MKILSGFKSLASHTAKRLLIKKVSQPYSLLLISTVFLLCYTK